MNESLTPEELAEMRDRANTVYLGRKSCDPLFDAVSDVRKLLAHVERLENPAIVIEATE